MTVKEHLQKVHTRSAEHHLTKAKAFVGLAKHFKLTKADMGDDADPEDISSMLVDLAEEENEMSSFHLECCAGLQKVQGGDLIKSDMDAIAADFVSSIIPEAPQHVRAVLRPGQREIGKGEVPAELEKLVSLD